MLFNILSYCICNLIDTLYTYITDILLLRQVTIILVGVIYEIYFKEFFRAVLGSCIGVLICISYEFISKKEISFYTIMLFIFLLTGVLIGTLIHIIFLYLSQNRKH